jgi:hypothetical protein
VTTVQVGGIGEVSIAFTDASCVIVRSTLSLLHEGRLYSFDGRLGRHGDRWYLASGETITGKATKAPKKVSDPISEAVADAVNDYLHAHPEAIAQAEANDRERKIKKLKEDLRWAITRIEEKRNEEREIRQKLRDLGEEA